MAWFAIGLSGLTPVQAQTEAASTDPASTDGIVARADLHQGHADVLRLYTAFFDRQPDAGGALYWIAQYNTCGWSTTRIAEFFSVSPEFAATHENLANRDFVSLLYANVLDRQADGPGATYWTSRLDSGESRGSVVADFAFSEEFRMTNPLPSDGRPNTGCVSDVVPAPTPLPTPTIEVSDCSTFTVTLPGADGYGLDWQVVTYSHPGGNGLDELVQTAASGAVGPAGPLALVLPTGTSRIEVSATAADTQPAEVVASAAVAVSDCVISHVQLRCESGTFTVMLPAGTSVLGADNNHCEHLVLPDGTELSATYQSSDADFFVDQLSGHWDDDVTVVSDESSVVDGQNARSLTVTGSGDETIRLWSIEAWGPGYWQLSAIIPNADFSAAQPSVDAVARSLVYLID